MYNFTVCNLGAALKTYVCLQFLVETTMVDGTDSPVNASIEEQLDQQFDLFEARTLNKIEMYADLVIIPLGVIMNILCLIIFVKSKISQSPTGLTLICLSIADNIVLVSSFLSSTQNWSNYIAIPSLVKNYSFICQGNHYLVNIGFLLSGLLLTSATIERYISVRFPLKVKSWNLYVKTKILLVVYFIASFGLSSFAFLCYNIVPMTIDRCLYSPKYDQICYVSEIIVNTVLSNGLCTLLIFIFTVLTSIELLKMRKNRAEMGTDSTKEFGISVMLVTVATLFLIFRIPEMILFQIVNHFLANNLTGSVLDNVLTLYALFYPLVTLNHSINFVIYFVFLKKFRDTFFSFFFYVKRKCVKSEEPD